MGKLFKTLIFDGEISLSIIDSTDIVNQAIKFHNLTPVCAAALGRVLTVTAFMASSLKHESEKLSITIEGNGKGGTIVTAADGSLGVRGLISNPFADLPLNEKGKLDVGGIVGNDGYITVIKNLGLKEPYVGRCNLTTGEIAEDFTAYYAYSEQQPTAMALGVLIGQGEVCIGAGGLIIQTLPNCSEESIIKAEKLISNFGDISAQIKDLGVEGIIAKYFSEYEFTEYNPVYRCNCSKDYMDGILITLGEKDLYEMVEKDGKIEICCHFCDAKYVYYKEDIDRLLGKNNG